MKPVSNRSRTVQNNCPLRSAWVSLLCIVTLPCWALTARAFTAADADTLFDAHTKAFYRVADGRAWHTKSTGEGKADFWTRAEQMEMVLDAYERTKNPKQIEMFSELFRGFLADQGTNWAHNKFNDDIMWNIP